MSNTQTASSSNLMPQASLSKDTSAGITKIAVMAVGGQGGGVLTKWIADLATRAGYAVQMTSVAGVAQRTGATIYYVEMAPASDRPPVFALSPSPGDVDIVLAAELMEAGRAIMRGFVTEDRTTLITSSHRVLAVSEKQVPGDGRAQAAVVTDRFATSALKSICFDMQAIADKAGTMISASLFGALAKSDALPFAHALFEEVIIASGGGSDQSLAAFHAALHYEVPQAAHEHRDATSIHPSELPTGPDGLVKRWQLLRDRIADFPEAAQPMLQAGLTKAVDFQDLDYGTEYLNHVHGFYTTDSADNHYELTIAAAKYIANAMCYDDMLRVADLKTRASREVRLRAEQQLDNEQIVHVTEYFHPRAEEFCATLPAGIGAWIENHPALFSLTQKLLNKGRRIRTDGMVGFGLLWLVAGARRYRRKLLRHRYESTHLDQLIAASHKALPQNYALAVEILNCQRLIKGYADTHNRGMSKFQRIIESDLILPDRPDSAQWCRKLRELALLDEQGEQLDTLLATQSS